MTTEVTVDARTRSNGAASAEVSPSQSFSPILPAPHHRAPLGIHDKFPVTDEKELDGCSRLVPLGRNDSETLSTASKMNMVRSDHVLTQSKPTGLTKDTIGTTTAVISTGPNQGENVKFLQDLLPTGTEGGALSPFQQHRPTEDVTSIGSRDELELHGSQVWTCLVSSADDQSVHSDIHHNDFERGNHFTAILEEEQRSNLLGAPAADTCASAGIVSQSPQETNDEHEDISAHAIASFPQIAPAAIELLSPTRRTPTLRRDGCADPDGASVTGASIVAKEPKKQVGLAVDSLVPRHLDREDRVSYLEARLQEALRAECSRSVLVTKVGKLEAEVKHLRERSNVHQREAAGWREQRQELRAAHSRLDEEFRLMVERCRRLEAEGRQKDVMLAEAGKRAGALEGAKSELEDALRYTNRLLTESQEEKKRAWQVTSKSAEATKAAMRRADTASREVETLRHEARLRHKSQPPSRDRRRGSAADDAYSPKDNGVSNVQLDGEDKSKTPERTVVEHAENQVRPVSPERGALAGVNYRLTTAGDSDFPKKPSDAWSISTPSPVERTPPRRRTCDGRPSAHPQSDPVRLSTDVPDSERSFFSLSKDDPSVSHPDYDASLERRAGKCASGDRERHDSERVRAALTGFTSAWTQTPVKALPELKRADGDNGRDARRESSGGRGDREHDQRGRLAYRRRIGSRSRDIDSKGVESSLCGTPPGAEGDVTSVTLVPSTLDWMSFSHEFPSGGHRRHRDDMACHRSSLTGSRVGVQAKYVTRPGESSRPEPESQVPYTPEIVVDECSGDPMYDASVASARTRSSGPPEPSVCIPNSTEGGTTGSGARGARLSFSSDQSAGTRMASSERARRRPDVAKQGKSTAIPFATDTEDPGFQLVQQMERDLVALQMEINQLDMERARLSPKATKTIQGRDRIRQVRDRLESLGKEATGIRRKIREHKKPSL